MRITINDVDYTKLSNLYFSDGVGLLGEELPIGQFSADIEDDGSLSDVVAGDKAWLYDDDDRIWAEYFIKSITKKYDGTAYSVVAQSLIGVLDRKMMPEVVSWSNRDDLPPPYETDKRTFEEHLVDMLKLALNATSSYDVHGLFRIYDSTVANTYIYGHLPEQDFRNRLQTLCFLAGAYVKQSFPIEFNGNIPLIEINKIDDDAEFVPMDRIYYKPDVVTDQPYTKFHMTVYHYTQTLRVDLEQYFLDETWFRVDDPNDPNNSKFYIQTKEQISSTNPNIPSISNQPEHTTTIDNQAVSVLNYQAIQSRIEDYIFNNLSVRMDLINNGDYFVGEKVIIPVNNPADGNPTLISGWIKSEDFQFGNKTKKSQVILSYAEEVDGIYLIIRLMCDTIQIGERRIYLPQEYDYTFLLDYLEIGQKAVFYPVDDEVTGTTGIGDEETVDAEYEVALDYYGGSLDVYDVDDAIFENGALKI